VKKLSYSCGVLRGAAVATGAAGIRNPSTKDSGAAGAVPVAARARSGLDGARRSGLDGALS